MVKKTTRAKNCIWVNDRFTAAFVMFRDCINLRAMSTSKKIMTTRNTNTATAVAVVLSGC